MWGMGHRGHVTRHSGGRCRDRGAIGPLFRQGSVLGRCRSVAPAAALLLAGLLLTALLLAGLLLAGLLLAGLLLAALLLAGLLAVVAATAADLDPDDVDRRGLVGGSIIGMRCEPSPAHTAHWAVPAWGSPATGMFTWSGWRPPRPSSI